MTIEQQLKLWLEGKPLHNSEQEECCPDFSCCSGYPIAPKEVRQRFYDAVQEGNETVKENMLYMFLGEAIKRMFDEKSGKKIHIVDPSAHEGDIH